MMKKIVLGVVIGVLLAAPASWAAASKCDAGISKAVGKKVFCKCGVYAKAQKKGLTPDAAKLAKCGTKFITSCGKAKAANDCAEGGRSSLVGSNNRRQSAESASGMSLCSEAGAAGLPAKIERKSKSGVLP